MKKIFLIALLLTPLFSFAGNDQGGGGGGYIHPITKEIILIDIALYDANFKDTHFDAALKMGPIEKEIGYERIRARDLVAGQRALEIVEKWRESSPMMVDSLKISIERLPLRFISSKVPTDYKDDSFPVKFHLDPSHLVGIGVYSMQFGTLVDINMYNALGDQNRAAFIIHEAARRLNFMIGAMGTDDV